MWIESEPLVLDFMRTIGLVLAAVMGAFCLQLFVRQHRLVFRPSLVLLPPPRDVSGIIEDVALQIAGGTVRGWWIPAQPRGSGTRDAAAGERRAVLYLPGAIGNFSHDAASLSYLHRRDEDVLVLDYPGYGRSEGTPTATTLWKTAMAGWDHLTGHLGRNRRNVMIVGRSLGSVLALRLAATLDSRLAGVVLHSAFVSISDVASVKYPFLPVRPFCLIRLDAKESAAQVRCPVLFVHGRDDRWIPESLGRRCFDLIDAPKRFISIRGGHKGAEWTTNPIVARALDDMWSGNIGEWS
jgi:uncharacterized protein